MTPNDVRVILRAILGVEDVDLEFPTPDVCAITVWTHSESDLEEIGRNVQHMIDKRLPLTCSFTFVVKVAEGL